jgi:hypothetical protein
MFDCIIMDLDGTCCDISHRLDTLEKIDAYHLAAKEPNYKPNVSIDILWNEFYNRAQNDSVIPQSLKGVSILNRNFRNLTYVTGRSESIRSMTSTWLKNRGFPPGRLFMRGATDHRPSTAVKVDLVKPFVGQRVLAVDDDPAILVEFHKLGFATMQSPHCWKSLVEDVSQV